MCLANVLCRKEEAPERDQISYELTEVKQFPLELIFVCFRGMRR
jgi:hypothetical protein